MEALWYAIAAFTLAAYVVMDGFDLGAGALHRWVARDDGERRQLLAAIGPFWDGNEVWLLAAGGVLFLAFPQALAAGLSGFYLAIMLILWLLILRGIAIEFRSQLGDGLWRSFWDTTFALASTLLPLLFGAALGNLLRGVPLDAEGWFALALFASFSPRGALGILDWFTLLAGLFALAALAQHGALFLAWKTEGALRERSRRAAAWLLPAVLVLWALATAASAALSPWLFVNLGARPLAWAASALFVAGLATAFAARRAGRDLLAFLGSGAFLLGLLGATAACLYPVLIPARDEAARSLTAARCATAPGSLAAGLRWWPPGLVLAIAYLTLLFRLHRGRVAKARDAGY